MTELDQRNARITMIYELRLIFSKDENKNYSAKEICEILDKAVEAETQNKLITIDN